MAQTSTVSPLALTAGAGLYDNAGIGVNAAFSTNKATYEAVAPIANLLFTINYINDNNGSLGISNAVFANLQTLGGNVSGNYFPALGDSAPSNVSITTETIGNLTAAGLTGRMLANANTYLGSGSVTKFAQAFAAAQGYISLTNQVINSVNNANEYLGPTFDGQENLITGDLARVNLAFSAFGQDLTAAGVLIDLGNLEGLGTPASLLQQISRAGNMVNGTLPAIRDALLAEGLTDQDISDLVNDNRQALFNPNGLTENQFDRLQRLAYPALCNITGADLADALTILQCTTPYITALCELLDPVRVFPNSYASLTLPTPAGPLLIYNQDGSVNSEVEPVLNSGSVTPRGCNDLAKIVPADQAAANRALQVALQQVKGIENLTLPELAQSLA